MSKALSVAEVQDQARKKVETGGLSEAVSFVCKSLYDIRSDVIALLNQNTGEIHPDEVESLISRVTVDRIQEKARNLLRQGRSVDALVFLRKELSRLRRRAARVTCAPFVEKTTVADFIEYLGEGDHPVPVAPRHEFWAPETR